MKRAYVLVLMLFSAVSMALADYLPVLEEGREWIFYEHINEKDPDIPDDMLPPILYHVGEQEMVEGKLCYKIIPNNFLECRYYNPLPYYEYEENGVVRRYIPAERWNDYAHLKCPGECPWLVVMDMNLKEGDEFHLSDVVKVDYICVDDVVRKRIVFENPNSVWVEGIGVSNYYVSDFYARPWKWSEERNTRFRQDDSIVFQYQDFFAPAYMTTYVDNMDVYSSISLQLKDGVICAESGDNIELRLSVYAADGSEMTVEEGVGNVSFPVTSLAAGVYVARAVGGGETRTLKWVQ